MEVQFVERLTPQFPRLFVGPLLSWIRYGWLIGTVCSLSFVVCLYHILPAWCDDIQKKQNLKVEPARIDVFDFGGRIPFAVAYCIHNVRVAFSGWWHQE